MREDFNPPGPDVLCAHVKAGSYPGLVLAALDQARKLYGPAAELAWRVVSEVTSSTDPGSGLFRTTVIVKCVNFGAIWPPGGTFIPDGLSEDAAELQPGNHPETGRPGISSGEEP